MSQKSMFYYGEDISIDMANECVRYLKSKNIDNFSSQKNDDERLQTEVKQDFIFSMGVFQHIVLFNVIVDYIKQSLN